VADFARPFAGTSNADFVFSEAGGRTDVIWSMFGRQTFIGKAMCLFMPMEKMVGPDFERGPAQLKGVVEEVELHSPDLILRSAEGASRRRAGSGVFVAILRDGRCAASSG